MLSSGAWILVLDRVIKKDFPKKATMQTSTATMKNSVEIP